MTEETVKVRVTHLPNPFRDYELIPEKDHYSI